MAIEQSISTEENSPSGGKLSEKSTIVALIISFSLISVGMVWSLFKAQSDLVRSSAMQNAVVLSSALQEFRTLYSSEVVESAVEHGMVATHDYQDKHGTIPLPATLAILFGEKIGTDLSGAKAHLYSPFPFPWRKKDNKFNSTFQKQAWQFLKDNPGDAFHKIETVNGKKLFRYAVADVMYSSCVNCHNNHPQSPKKDWKNGDLRGILEVDLPLEELNALSWSHLKQTTILIFFTIFLLLFWIINIVLKLSETSNKKQLLIDSQTVKLREELENSELAKKEQESLLQELNQQKFAMDEHAIISAANIRGDIIYVNDKFCEISGYAREELMGNNHRMVKSDEHSREFYQNLWKTISGGRTWHGEVKNLTKKGQPYWVRATIVPFMNKKGKPFKYVSIRTDVTVMKELEDKLTIAKQEAEEATRTKSDFLANMSHEIRTPMNAVIGMSHLALQTELTDKQADYLKKIQSSSNSLLGIINDILDFSKIEAGKLTMETIDFHLDYVLDNLATIVNIKVEEKGLELIFSRPENVPDALIGDPTRLGQVLINLCNNAVKFTDNGEVFVGAELLERKGDKVHIKFSIKDTGIGMTPEQTSKLFRAFSQADTSTTRKYGGTGLGLSISKRLVEMMEGEIWVDSEPDKGSQFFFTAWFGRKPSQDRTKTLLASDLKGTRVLVVDDNDSSRTILQEILASFSFDVTTVNSGQQAIEAIAQNSNQNDHLQYQLVLMDWKMPGMTGLEAAKIIKENNKSATSPKIILVTAYGREEVLSETKKNVIDGYLLKPVNPSLILDSIMNVFSLDGGGVKAKSQTKARDVDAIKGILGAKVLLAEDNQINQQVATELLEGNGLVVTVVNNGEEAVEAIKNTSFDVVLMDIQMPVMDGMEATAAIRKDSRYEKTPILAMTAHAMAGDREKSLAGGMNDHITKPIDPDKLFDSLVKWIPAKNRGGSLPTQTQGEQKEEELPDNLHGIDINEGLKRVGGNKKLFKKLLKEFFHDYKDVIASIRSTIQKGDFIDVQRTSHTLKGVAGAIGAENLYQAALLLETGIKDEKATEYQTLIADLNKALTPILNGLESLHEDVPQTIEEVDVTNDGPDELIYPELLKPLLEELVPLLKTGHSKATAKVAEIRELVGSKAQVQLATIDEQIDDFEYDEALDTLIKLAESLNISISNGD
ncbi:MAG: response regulator [Magnetococcales bacterium]|nr:response regulator [Magnetococcales bacterium]